MKVILALNATVDGQTTAHYLAETLAPTGVQITSLAQGVPIGGELNYLDGLRPRAIATEGQTTVLEQLMPSLSEQERRVLDCFRGGGQLGIDVLAATTGLGTPEISAALMMLELKKLVAKKADGNFEARG